MQTVLLTGASGYIGKHVALALLQEGYTVRASVRNQEKADEVRAAMAAHLSECSDLEVRLSFVELDLEDERGWEPALRGVDALVHTASPFPIAAPRNENEVIRPAVEGTKRALRAAKAAGVNRVVLTSSIAAIYGCELPAEKSSYDEELWTDVTHPIGRGAYTKSKTLAERAAWDFVRNEAPDIVLTTINPVLVLGAPLDRSYGSSISIVERIMKGKDPMLPDLSFSIVDVRDVARMHVKALSNQATHGQRIIASAGTISFVEIAKTLKALFPKSRAKTLRAPSLLIRFLALFDGEIRAIVPMLGRSMLSNQQKAIEIFGEGFIPIEESLRTSGAFLIVNGMVTGIDDTDGTFLTMIA